jgi:hypothetical protein
MKLSCEEFEGKALNNTTKRRLSNERPTYQWRLETVC